MIATHFTEVWSDLDCNEMCDYCLNRSRVRAAAVDIRPMAGSLYKILENAAKTDAKLTGAKLIDAWFQKGPSINRCASVEAPSINRYFAEQVVAYLITNHYLKEDFHFTAYATISYITRGIKNAAIAKHPIEFQCARLQPLPNLPSSHNTSALNSTLETATDGSGDEVVFVSESLSERKRKKKKSKSKTSEKRAHKNAAGSIATTTRKDKSSEKRRKNRFASEADSMSLANRMLDFLDDESTYGGNADEADTSMPSPSAAARLGRLKKKRKLIDETNRVELRVGENDDLVLVQRNSDVIDVDSS